MVVVGGGGGGGGAMLSFKSKTTYSGIHVVLLRGMQTRGHKNYLSLKKCQKHVAEYPFLLNASIQLTPF